MQCVKLALILGLVISMPAVVSAQDAKDRLVGKWQAKIELDEEKMIQLMIDQGTPEELIDMILPTVKEQFANALVKVEFKADGTAVFDAEGLPQAEGGDESQWEVVEEDGDKVTVKGTDEDGTEEIMTIEFDGDDKFTMMSDELKDAPLKPPVFERVDD